MNYLHLTRVTIFLCMAIFWESSEIEFCADNRNITSVFTLGDITYLQKGNVFYTKRLNETFKSKQGLTAQDLFGIGKRMSSHMNNN